MPENFTAQSTGVCSNEKTPRKTNFSLHAVSDGLLTIVGFPWQRGAPAEADGASCLAAAAAAFGRFNGRPASRGVRGGVAGGAGHMLRLGPRGPALPAGSAYGLGAAAHRAAVSEAAAVSASHRGWQARWATHVLQAMPCTAFGSDWRSNKLKRYQKLLVKLRGQAMPEQSRGRHTRCQCGRCLGGCGVCSGSRCGRSGSSGRGGRAAAARREAPLLAARLGRHLGPRQRSLDGRARLLVSVCRDPKAVTVTPRHRNDPTEMTHLSCRQTSSGAAASSGHAFGAGSRKQQRIGADLGRGLGQVGRCLAGRPPLLGMGRARARGKQGEKGGGGGGGRTGAVVSAHRAGPPLDVRRRGRRARGVGRCSASSLTSHLGPRPRPP